MTYPQLDIFTTLKSSPTIATDRTYFNTTEKKGTELERATVKASGQTEIILKFFQDHPTTTFTPWDIYFHLGQQLMITSVRRAITTLTNAGYLVKTQERRRSGPANETSFTWRLK